MSTFTGLSQSSTSSDQQLTRLGQVLQALREANDSAALIEVTLSYLKATGSDSYDTLWLGLYDGDVHQLVGKGGILPVGHASEVLHQRLPLTAGDLMEQVVIQQRPLAIADLRQEVRAGEWQGLAEKLGLQGTMLFPISYRDRCLGLLLVGSQQWGAFPSTQEKTCLGIVLGELGSALNYGETRWQQEQIKQPDKALSHLLGQLCTLETLGQHLEVVVEATQRFIGALRTSVYWFEPNQRFFWRRLSHQAKRSALMDTTTPAASITAQDMHSFYQVLQSNQLVTITDDYSALSPDATVHLLQLLQLRSLIAAPIVHQNQLLGFLAVEESEPRVWQAEEQQYLHGVAQLISLVAPLEPLQTAIEQTQADRALMVELAQSVYSQENWRTIVSQTADLLGQRLTMDRLIVIVHDADSVDFEVCYQNHPRRHRPLPTTLPLLGDLDHQLLEQSQSVVGIDNLDDDLRLAAWHKSFSQVGIKALMACSTAPGCPLEAVVMVAQEAPRSWTAPELDLLRIVAQQLGVILHQWHLQRQQQQIQSLQAALFQAVEQLQQITDLETLYQVALKAIAYVTESPVAVLMDWFPGDVDAQLVLPPEMVDRRFRLQVDARIAIDTDPLLQRVLHKRDLFCCASEAIPEASQQWLGCTEMGKILALPLSASPDQTLAGIVLVLDAGDRRWSDRHCWALRTLVNQLSRSRQTLRQMTQLQTAHLTLSQLAWYKQRYLEVVHRLTSSNVQKLLDLANLDQDPLVATTQQQILRQITDVMTPLQQTLQGEIWALQLQAETLPLIRLLRRCLERLNDVIKERQLWSQVHQDGNPLVQGDALKLEMILYEVTLSACLRSPQGGRIDLWCRQFDPSWVEVAVTDGGAMAEALMEELNQGGELPASLRPQGLELSGERESHWNLLICKTVLKPMGGDLSIVKLDDGRLVSRLMFPSAETGCGILPLTSD
jgi:GAF domain-containing protein